MSITTHNPTAAAVAKEYAGEIAAVHAYLVRVGFAPAIAAQATAEAVAQLALRPDITRKVAYATTVARGEAERLRVTQKASKDLAPDLMAVLTGTKPSPKRRQPVKQARTEPVTGS